MGKPPCLCYFSKEMSGRGGVGTELTSNFQAETEPLVKYRKVESLTLRSLELYLGAGGG